MMRKITPINIGHHHHNNIMRTSSSSFCCCLLLLILQLQGQRVSCLDYFDPSSSLNRQPPQQQRLGALGGPAVPSPVGGDQQQQQQQRMQRQQQFAGGASGIGTGNNHNLPYQPQQQQRLPPSSGGSFPQQQQHQLATATNFAAHQAAGILPFGNGLTNNQQQRQLEQTEFGRQLQQQQHRNSTNNNNYPHPASSAEAGSQGNLLVEVHIRSFANPGFRLPNNRLCTCPQGNEHCTLASPQRTGYNCLTSVSVFVLSADLDLKYAETSYYPLDRNGQLGADRFQVPYQFHLDAPPSAIGVLVHNLGPQIDPDGSLYDTNAVTTVDQFTHSLNGTLPGGGGSSAAGSLPFGGGGGTWGQQQEQNVNLQGHLLGTQLSLSYTVSCRGARGPDGKPLVGPGCDLSCNTSSATTNTAICVNQKTGYYSQCRWTTGNTQVTNCQNCPWGIKEDAYCADAQGGVLQPDHAGVVSSFYYKAFVVLCAVCVLLLILLLLLCLTVISRRNIKNRRRQGAAGSAIRAPPAPRNNNEAAAAAGFVHRGEPQAPIPNSAAAFRLENAGNKAPPPYSIRSNIGGPLAVPRSTASTASANSDMNASIVTAGGGSGSGRRFPPILPPLVVGGKSGKAFSPPRYQPLPHLGPAGGTDSLNTSFAGSQTVPLPPPSVSADV